jgi:Putative Flp pilus-assembly TadE/G-like
MLRPSRSQICLGALLRRLIADTQGGILAFSVVLLVFVLGTGGLILDFGRVWNSQSELQAFADHAALVAAGELDGNPDAITRSNAALAQLISDRQAYASQDVTLDENDLQVTFLSGLPAADTDDNFGPFVTVDPALAQFVRVAVNPHTVSTIFADALLAVSGNDQVDFDVGAAAVAGYTQFVCDISPLMFCPPAGMDRETLRSWLPGRQIRLKAQNFWGPARSVCSTSTSTRTAHAAAPIRAPTSSAARSQWNARSRAAFRAAASTFAPVRRWARPSPDLIPGSTSTRPV